MDAFLANASQWQQEYRLLREILLDSPLVEAFKWGKPCYALDGKNVVLMHGFKDYCALLFMKGALIQDPERILVAQTENVQSARQIRFTGVADIASQASTLEAYLREAIAVEKAGKAVDFKPTNEFPVAEEFQNELDRNPALKTAFEQLTPGRQRGYLLHFSGAKQSRTRQSRVENCVPRILDGKGLSDR
ncbi:YdeI/OmpD-associated family protein [Marinobacter sp. SS21]|uniref:YdeI/OmpD-associated family protein n=1 Tax=Marinobacter sp. SS21 TaxID=2979460 RepID=UPI00232F5496|nr:YdeI/OmpD-associated family protein [Marinobacter sp. SS21]MDC0661024.1 YdeI/OmpD-associated family protein [Marinobacter sp. SS21]